MREQLKITLTPQIGSLIALGVVKNITIVQEHRDILITITDGNDEENKNKIIVETG